ncbi:MAG: peptide ABC transporter substrate-binding protein [Chloroflexales bacterium]|nr:peptide ABC transporter substrate-binding protein [Chloroflexales bacterium]
MKLNGFFRMLLVMVALSMAAACGSAPSGGPDATNNPSSSDTTTTTDSAPNQTVGEPQRGGIVTVGLFQEPTTTNSYFTTKSVDGYVSNLVFEPLVQVNTESQYEPSLAVEVPTLQNGGVSEDGKTITYKLAQDVIWSDGEPFTSADVKFTYDVIMNDANPVVSRGIYQDIGAIETPDPYTVIVKWENFYAPYLRAFSGGILPAHVFGGNTDISKSDFDRNPVGTGPFVVKEWIAADHITFVPNPNYREAGKPYVDQIIFKIVPNPDVATEQLKAGQLDVVMNLRADQVATIEQANDPSLVVMTSKAASVERVTFNLAQPGDPADPSVPHPVLSDIKVRQALELATPRRDIVEKLIGPGKADLTGSTIPIGWAADPSITMVEYDIDQAKQILDEASWIDTDGDGIREKDGQKLQFSITSTSEKLRSLIMQLLAERWQEIGVQLDVKNVDSSVLFGSWGENGLLTRGNFEAAVFASSYSIDPQTHIFSRYHSLSIATPENGGQGTNYSRLNDPDLDQLIDVAGSTPDQDERIGLYRQINQQINAQHSNIWLYARIGMDAHRDRVQGLVPHPWASATFNTEDWYVVE